MKHINNLPHEPSPDPNIVPGDTSVGTTPNARTIHIANVVEVTDLHPSSNIVTPEGDFISRDTQKSFVPLIRNQFTPVTDSNKLTIKGMDENKKAPQWKPQDNNDLNSYDPHHLSTLNNCLSMNLQVKDSTRKKEPHYCIKKEQHDLNERNPVDFSNQGSLFSFDSYLSMNSENNNSIEEKKLNH